MGTLKDQTNVKPAFDIFIEDKADFVILNGYTAKFKKGIPVEPDIIKFGLSSLFGTNKARQAKQNKTMHLGRPMFKLTR